MYRYLLHASQNSWKSRYSLVSTKTVSFIEVSLQLRGLVVRLGSGGVVIVLGGAPALRVEEGLDGAATLLEGLAQGPTAVVPGLDDLAGGHGLARQFLADGPADEPVVVEHPDLGDVPRVVAQEHLLADEGGERGVDVAHPEEPDA